MNTAAVVCGAVSSACRHFRLVSELYHEASNAIHNLEDRIKLVPIVTIDLFNQSYCFCFLPSPSAPGFAIV